VLACTWLRRLLPVFILSPAAVVSSGLLMAPQAHAASTCDPLEISVSTKAGVESALFTYTNCGTTTSNFTISGHRQPPKTCSGGTIDTGDVVTRALKAGKSAVGEYHSPAPTCPGIYRWSADIELGSTETVLDRDSVTYTVV
jgi:hypothetical protein